jgi:RNA polymerase sigma-70 factor (ECF subfamily)
LFYRRHLGAMLAFFLRRTGNPELAADLAAEVFAAALNAARGYRGGDRPALAWLYGIAAHKLSDSRRRGVVESKARKRLALEPLIIEDSDLARIEQLAGSQADRDRIEEALRSLPASQRDAVLARVVQERDYPEIAHQMACSELVVRQRVSRALGALRSKLEEAS